VKLLILFFLFSIGVFAEANVEEICKPLSRSQGWHRGDTVFWEGQVSTDYRSVVNNSRSHAIRNTTFKEALSSAGYDLERINQSNSLRLQQECDVTNLDSGNCHHFKAYCMHKITTETLNDSFDNFNHCALARRSYCGESFQTPEGIMGNLRALERAAGNIFEVQDEIREDPNLNMYFGDVVSSYDQLRDRLEEVREQANRSIASLEEEIEDEYHRIKREDDRFQNACDILDQCDDYLEHDGYSDDYSLLNQVGFCRQSQSYEESELTELSRLMDNVKQYNSRVDLKDLAITSLDNSIEQTVLEYASTYKALHGVKPSQSQMCTDLEDFCRDPKARSALRDLDLSQVQRLNSMQEIHDYNVKARELNQICESIVSQGASSEQTQSLQQKLTGVMYNTRIGQLMAVKDFRDEVGAFDQEKCMEDGEGFELISESSSGVELLEGGIEELIELQKDKAEKSYDQKRQITYTGNYLDANDPAYYSVLKEVIRNDPYMVRESIRNSGSPEHALWICKATHDIYKTESRERIGTWIGTGLAIAGAVVATVFTFGAATPLLIGSIALATGVGVYNLNNAMTARHNAEMSVAIQSSEALLASMQLGSLDTQVKMAYAEVAMSLLPAATSGLKLAGKAVGPLLRSSRLLNAIPAGTRLTGASQRLMSAIRAGREITEEMLQRALASKLPSASPERVRMLANILRGTSEDMTIEMIAFVSAHPDPFSEEGMQAMALALGTSTAFNSLGAAGQQWVLRRKAAQTSDIVTSTITNNTSANSVIPNRQVSSNLVDVSSTPQYRSLEVVQDANLPTQQQSLTLFTNEVQVTDDIATLMNNAHLAEPGVRKNRQISLLIREVADQVGDARARQLVLGTPNADGVRVGGLASEDVMILGTQRPMRDWLDGCVNSDCIRLERWVKRTDPNVQLDPFNRQLQIRKHINEQIQNSTTSLHGNKHLKADINTRADFESMTNAQKSQGQYFNEIKNRLKNGSELEKQLLRDNRIGTVDIKDGVMYKYIEFDEFKELYPELANKLDGGFGFGANCSKGNLATLMRIEMTNSSSPVIHSHPRC
tara:strand:+ start:73032 stop:76211 length:3180 start_codon:yes stop_codon:yes gene_type:complete